MRRATLFFLLLLAACASGEPDARITLVAEERDVIIEGKTAEAWMFNGTVPGPLLRVTEGDSVELTLRNDESSRQPHSIDLHAVTGPGGGARHTEVLPGEERTILFEARHPGLYVYHCATPSVPEHVAKGMYGLILVEPHGGLPPVDREYYLMQGELYLENGTFSRERMEEERPSHVVFNGRPDALVDEPLTAETGDSIRLLVGNGGVAKHSAFHIIGEVFDSVAVEGGSLTNHDVQTTSIPPGGASIIELGVEVPGTYALVDHALVRIEQGALGHLVVKGEDDPSIFSPVE